MVKKSKKPKGFGVTSHSDKSSQVPSRQGLTHKISAIESLSEGLDAHVAALKARKMDLETFRSEFQNDFELIELQTGSYYSSETGDYTGQLLAVRYQNESGPPEVYPMPDASAAVPDDVFDYLSSYWS